MEIEHLTRGTRVTKSVASLYRIYAYLPWCIFLFMDRSGKEQEIHPDNLGDAVDFYVLPGPDGRPPEE